VHERSESWWAVAAPAGTRRVAREMKASRAAGCNARAARRFPAILEATAQGRLHPSAVVLMARISMPRRR
jgi:hypothetical protein